MTTLTDKLCVIKLTSNGNGKKERIALTSLRIGRKDHGDAFMRRTSIKHILTEYEE